MLNLIKADLYKILRNKIFYIFGIFVVLHFLYEVKRFMPMGFSGQQIDIYVLQNYNFLFPCLNVFMVIFSSMYMENEFSYGTIRNAISSGFSRVRVYFSNLIVMSLSAFMYVLLISMFSFLAFVFLRGFQDISYTYFINSTRLITRFMLIQITVQSITYFIFCIFKKAGWTLLTMFLSAFFIMVAAGLFDSFMNFPTLTAIKYTPVYYVLLFCDLDHTLGGNIMLCFAYLIPSIAIGAYLFKKMDIL